MKQFFVALLLLIAPSTVLLSCSKKSGSSAGGDETPENYVVKGKITDLAGNPVSGVKIRAQNPNGTNIHVDGFSGADGTYKLKLSAIGGWMIYAWKEVDFNGELYYFRMGMATDGEYEAFTPSGAPVIRNFVWKLSGRIPDRTVSKENGTGYFGGTIRFTNYNSVTPEIKPGTEVTVSFTPVADATYADGSSAVGKVITKSFTIAAGVGQAYYLTDIPFTRYSISAKAGGKTVQLGANDTDNFAEKHNYTMPSAGGTSYESGIGSPNEHSFYLAQQ